MVRPTRGSVWLSLLATLEITTGAALAHLAAGGELPSAGWLAAAALAVFATGLVVLQRRVGLLGGAVAAGVTQLGLHEVFAALAEPTTTHQHASGQSSMLLAHGAAAVLAVLAWVLHRRAFDVVTRCLPIVRPAARGTQPVMVRHAVPQPGLWAYARPRRGPPALLCA
ncbi:cell division protein FtsQ [Nocardioides albertanoniae]|uniref:cell division protein FtsQ n=1 Tax=Nocardioides albertanoniae TaxID=1175486 RepID=UPI001FE90421|nr:cell division protein FtsQ [Nocardioides albertanoniae]